MKLRHTLKTTAKWLLPFVLIGSYALSAQSADFDAFFTAVVRR